MSKSTINPQVSRAPFVPVAGPPRPSWPGYLALVALTVLVYLPVLRAGFIWNDPDYVTKPELRSLTGLWRIWFEVGATEQYYPLLHSAFWVQHRLWGDSAAGYHLFNVLLHAACACLLVVAVRRVWGVGSGVWRKTEDGARGQSAIGNRQSAMFIPWLAGFLFAVHPVYVESVAWISEQKNTQSLLFYLLAGIAYLRFAGSESDGPAARPYPQSAAGGAEAPVGLPRWAGPFDKLRAGRGWYFIATAFFILAILSKSLTATLPAALLVVLWWRRGRLDWRRDWVPLLPWFVLGAGAGVFTGWVEHSVIGAKGEDFALGFIERGVLAGRVIWFYLGKFFWPAELIFIYPRWTIDASSPIQWLFPIAAVGVLAGLWLLRRRARGPLAAYLFFTGSLFPTMGFFNVYAFKFSYVADHWNYLPSIGLLVGIAWVVVILAGRLAKLRSSSDGAVTLPAPVGPELVERAAHPYLGTRVIAVGVILTAVLGTISWRQTHGYRDIETFYRTIIARNPDSWLAQYNLAERYILTGRLAEAVAPLEEALRVRPQAPDSWNNLAGVLLKLGRVPEAIAHYEQALRLSPNDADFHQNFALALATAGRMDEAIARFREAIRLRPGYIDAHRMLAQALGLTGRLDEARAERAIVERLEARAVSP